MFWHLSVLEHLYTKLLFSQYNYIWLGFSTNIYFLISTRTYLHNSYHDFVQPHGMLRLEWGLIWVTLWPIHCARDWRVSFWGRIQLCCPEQKFIRLNSSPLWSLWELHEQYWDCLQLLWGGCRLACLPFSQTFTWLGTYTREGLRKRWGKNPMTSLSSGSRIIVKSNCNTENVMCKKYSHQTGP